MAPERAAGVARGRRWGGIWREGAPSPKAGTEERGVATTERGWRPIMKVPAQVGGGGASGPKRR